jgi:hypothetical protein
MTLTFEQWMSQIDRAIARICGGLTADDLPDYDYRGDYNARRDPQATAARAIRAAKCF